MVHPGGQRPGDQSKKQNQGIRRICLKSKGQVTSFTGTRKLGGHSRTHSVGQQKRMPGLHLREDIKMRKRHQSCPQECKVKEGADEAGGCPCRDQ